MSSLSQQALLPEYLRSLTSDADFFHDILEHTRQSLSVPTFNHSLRVFLLAVEINKQDLQSGKEFKMPSLTTRPHTVSYEYLFAASMFHDMGTCPSHNGPQRFEVEGGDAAVEMLSTTKYNDEEQMQQVWTAIAMHDSAGLAERINPMTSLLRRAVKADFDSATRDGLGLTAYAAEIEVLLPRLDIERVLAAEVVAQATRGEKENGLLMPDGSGRWTDNPKFPKASWPGVLLRAHLEKVRDHGQAWQGSNPAF